MSPPRPSDPIRYVDQRIASTRVRHARELEVHERGDKRVVLLIGAIVVAVVGAIATLGTAIVNNCGEKHKREAINGANEAMGKRLGSLEEDVRELQKDARDLREQQRIDRALCRARRDPDLITSHGR